jgi:hypothetical protein
VSSHLPALALVLAVWLTVSVVVGVDAARRGRSAGVWTITAFLLGPLGLGLYVLAVLGAAARPDAAEGDGAGEGGADDDGSDGDGGDDGDDGDDSGGARGADDDGGGGEGSEGGNDGDGTGGREPASLVRSGARIYCGDCTTRVSADADRCPNCGAAF